MVSESIIINCIRGKRPDQKALYESCAPYVYAIIKTYIVDYDYRKDAMQEVFAEIFLSLDKYNAKKGSFKSWIGKITVYSCIDLLKKNQKLELSYGLELLKDISDSAFEEMDSLSREDIEKLLINMPTGYRTIFLLSVIDNFSHKEIGKMLEISSETSRSQLSRAKNWLKKNFFLSSSKLMYEAL